MDRSIFTVWIGFLWIVLSIGQVHATEPPWRGVKEMPFVVRNDLELARQPQGKTLASLYLVCSQTNELHLILSTRLPAPRWSIRRGRDDDVSLFVGGINHEIKLVMDLVEKGPDITWLESALSREGEGAPDTLVTTTIGSDEISTIATWFGDAPPEKVSVVGYSETGVYMAGRTAGPAVTKFSASCVAR